MLTPLLVDVSRLGSSSPLNPWACGRDACGGVRVRRTGAAGLTRGGSEIKRTQMRVVGVGGQAASDAHRDASAGAAIRAGAVFGRDREARLLWFRAQRCRRPLSNQKRGFGRQNSAKVASERAFVFNIWRFFSIHKGRIRFKSHILAER